MRPEGRRRGRPQAQGLSLRLAMWSGTRLEARAAPAWNAGESARVMVVTSERQTRCPDSPRNPAMRQIGDDHQTKNTAIPLLTGDERCWARGTTPVCRDLAVGDLNARRAAWNPPAWWPAGYRAMHRLCNGSLSPGRTGCPSPPTWPGGRWGRCSRVFFPGDPDPASQHPRFSASLLPGTRPCRRKWFFCCCLHHIGTPQPLSRGLTRFRL